MSSASIPAEVVPLPSYPIPAAHPTSSLDIPHPLAPTSPSLLTTDVTSYPPPPHIPPIHPVPPSSPPLPAAAAAAHRIPSKAQDLLFGGNKSLATRPASNSVPSSTAPSSKRTSQSGVQSRDGKVYDVLGESKALIEVFRDQSKAFHMLGVLDDRSEGRKGRRRRRRTLGRQHSLSLDGGAESLGLVEKMRTLWRASSPAPASAAIPSAKTKRAVLARTLPAAALPPLPSAHPSTAPSALLSSKARSLLFSPKARNKLHDRLGMTVAMMELFSSQPKAFQRLGLFDGEGGKERRMNVSGVVISGMRQLCVGWMYVLEGWGGGVVKRVRRKYWVLTLDALTWYADEDDMVAEGEINLLHGAVVKVTAHSTHAPRI